MCASESIANPGLAAKSSRGRQPHPPRLSGEFPLQGRQKIEQLATLRRAQRVILFAGTAPLAIVQSDCLIHRPGATVVKIRSAYAEPP